MHLLVILAACVLAQASLVPVPPTLLERRNIVAPRFHQPGLLGVRQATCGLQHTCRNGGCCSGQCCLNGCCPLGYVCNIVDSNTAGCCPIGRVCTGPPTGCTDSTLVECANYSHCCPRGQTCSVDPANGNAAQCNGVTIGPAPGGGNNPPSSSPPPPPEIESSSSSSSSSSAATVAETETTSVAETSTTISRATTTATSNPLPTPLSSFTPQNSLPSSSPATGNLSGAGDLKTPGAPLIAATAVITMGVLFGTMFAF